MKLTILFGLAVYLVGCLQLVNAAGSWCNEPKNEAFWGAATASCCNGWMGNDRRCYGITDCNGFYRCCKNRWRSNNRVGIDRCD